MTFELKLSCDAPGCGAEESIPNPDGPGDDFPPSIADGTIVTFDTGWISLPAGWVAAEGGDFCPDHSGAT